MQLLFFYNPLSKNQNSGINFSPEYDFKIEYNNNSLRLLLDSKKRKDIFKNYKNIVSVSTIVGENGSGKTTLFKCILGNTDIQNINIVEEVKNPFIFIFENDGFIEIYKNISGIQLIIDNSVGKYCKYKEYDEREKDPFHDTSIIYYTNSHYEKWAIGDVTCGHIRKIHISPAAEFGFSRQYYNKIITHNEYYKPIDICYYWEQKLLEFKTSNGIQDILDLLFLNKIKDKGICKNLLRNEFKVRFETISNALNYGNSNYLNYKNKNNPWNEDKEVDYEERLFWNAKIIEKKYHELTEKDKFCRYLYYNLLFEFCAYLNIEIPNEIVSIDDAILFIKNNINKLEKRKKYIKAALLEISSLETIAQCSARVKNKFDKNDAAYDRSMVFAKGGSAYKSFLMLIDHSFRDEKNGSFLIRYLSIEQYDYSSGQRCLQNIISWLMLLPDLNFIKGNNIEALHKSIILCIDEIDLYLHPEWQRRIINELINILSIYMPEYKIQIIFSTHSPICLSDIPVQNCVYLYKENGKYKVKNRDESSQSFGKEIYALYKDSFFLNNTIGEFSTNYINKIIEKVNTFENKNDENSNEQLELLKEEIELVGNSLLKQYLQDKLKK